MPPSVPQLSARRAAHVTFGGLSEAAARGVSRERKDAKKIVRSGGSHHVMLVPRAPAANTTRGRRSHSSRSVRRPTTAQREELSEVEIVERPQTRAARRPWRAAAPPRARSPTSRHAGGGLSPGRSSRRGWISSQRGVARALASGRRICERKARRERRSTLRPPRASYWWAARTAPGPWSAGPFRAVPGRGSGRGRVSAGGAHCQFDILSATAIDSSLHELSIIMK